MAGESLARVERRFLAEEARLGALVQRSTTQGDEWSRRSVAEYALIALHDAWNRFARDLILASALGSVTPSGVPIPRTHLAVTNRRSALLRIRVFYGENRSWWEPGWHDPTHAARASTALAITNAPTVTAAFGASANPIEEVRWVRNFVAHRGPATADRCEQIGANYHVADSGSPSAIATHLVPTASNAQSLLFEVWCGRLRSIARAAAG